MGYVIKDVADHRLRAYIQKRLRGKPGFSSVKYCGTKINPTRQTQTVMIISDGKKVIPLGTQNCNSPWICPTCFPHKMNILQSRITAAIEACEKQELAGFMITLTLPHIKPLPLKITIRQLKAAWRRFNMHAYVKSRTHSALGNFIKEFDVKYRFMAYEVTYGENGWHPHIHALWFVPKKKLQKVAEHEQLLRDHWNRSLIKEQKILKEWATEANFDLKDFLKRAEKGLYAKASFYISKTKDGKIRKADSASYFASWDNHASETKTKRSKGGIENEVTRAGLKTAREGHKTQFQLIADSFLLQKTNPEKSNRYWELFYEFAQATQGLAQTKTSKWLGKLIKDYMMTNEFKLILKKKATKEQTARWKLICWFTKQQWLQLTIFQNDNYAIADILDLAKFQNGKELIIKYCFLRGVDISQNNDTRIEIQCAKALAAMNMTRKDLPEPTFQPPIELHDVSDMHEVA